MNKKKLYCNHIYNYVLVMKNPSRITQYVGWGI